MNKPLSLLLLIGTVAGLSACESEKPFVLSDYRYHQRGVVQACYAEEHASIEDVLKLVNKDICSQYDRIAEVQLVQPMQCSWTASTLVTLHCVARPGENPGPILQHGAPMRHDTPLPGW